MELRPELMPPVLDEAKVARLAALAGRLDGARPGQWEDDLAEFNQLAGTAIPFDEFQGISGGQSHRDWVRQVLYRQAVAPVPDLSREEMAEIVSRVKGPGADRDFYLGLFGVNCRHSSGTDLIFWPDLVPELPQGREPTAKEIAELAMR
jgi:hypothetical protein